ncbi:uncharacterized protein LOC100160326 precursor [Acyrthosiphon pisum]|uniref:ACYPI001630 protein n=1 Tax=Acyrthosiphon pisum TaxID=7029 RepID=C4WX01_ACYPI|nr:uncharacterized protein LOC100160326 precursor [Acyrthosiphon pisum]BAH72421.1 ACYPI001630 [Acyrthosiphon pisum]|eukprot:NP_001232983.1 uncharacterized protein LOC100160326 precursor [Acyrthosiphon pisum]
MIYRAIALFVAVQSVVVASPTATMSHGENIVSPIGTFYHPTPSSRARGLPEVGKLPRTSAMSKKLSASGPDNKPWLKLSNAGNSHLSRNGRFPALMDTYQPPRTRSNHMRLEESHRSEEERAEKINSDLEKMIQFMTVLGQVDRYLSSRAKSFVSTLGRAMENNPDDHHLYNDKDVPLDY